MKNVAVLLSGCGVYDGSEIHEAVLTLLALERANCSVTCAAPDIAQKHVINHLNGEEMIDSDRNVLTEAARISRGQIQPLDSLKAEDFDALIFIGGFGAAKNLSSYAFDGDAYDVDPGVIDLIQAAHEASKATGFMCIAPVLAARALGNKNVKLTIGNDPATSAALEGKGATAIECPVDEAVVDLENKVVSTPGYMLAESILEVEEGINALVGEVLALS